jgi:lipopolysaccharide exporter
VSSVRFVDSNSSIGSISRAAARSIVWACCSVGAAKLLTLAMMMALARLLTPADFGLMAFALVFMMYLEMVGDLGTSAALVYWPTREEEAARVSFFISVAMGWVWFAVTIALAPYVATFFHTPHSATILRVLAWSFPIKAFGATQDALCQKRLRFGQRLIPELAQAGLKAAVAIGLALAGFGVWSLVWGQLVGVAAWTAMLWVFVGWRPGTSVSWGLARPMLRYGLGVIAIHVTAAVLYQVDLVIVGRVAGAATLGVYQLAGKIPEVLLALPVRVAGAVLFPAFARFKHDGGPEHLERAYLAAMRYGALITWPVMTALIIFAPSLVSLAFGERWVVAVPLVRTLAVYGLLRSLASPAGDVIKAIGRPGLLALLGAIRAAVLVPALIIAGRTGRPLAIAITLTVVMAGATLLNQVVVSRVAHIRLRDIAPQFVPGMLAAGVFALIASGGALLVGHLDLLRVAVLALFGSAFGAMAVRLHSPSLLSGALSMLRAGTAGGPLAVEHASWTPPDTPRARAA